MFQKRWVKFDGDSISYYNNEKVSDTFALKMHVCNIHDKEIIMNEYLS